MIAALILVVSLAMLMQFFVSYCRSVIAAGSKEELSLHAREVTGIADREVPADDFHRLVQLADLCPEAENERDHLRAVRLYYVLISFVRAALEPVAPRVAAWAQSERQSCGYFAAVVLDRRIAYSRNLLAAEMSNQP